MEDMHQSCEQEHSPAGQRLISLCGGDGDVARVLKENPELIDGLDQYVKWRDKYQQAIASQTMCAKSGHELMRLADSIALPPLSAGERTPE